MAGRTTSRSAEVEAAGTGALQLEEVRVPGDHPETVEESRRLLASRNGVEDRTEVDGAVVMTSRLATQWRSALGHFLLDSVGHLRLAARPVR